jgi:two-component system, chemotaxis family, chemotaxis protein CheY
MAQILLLDDNPDMLNAISDFLELRGHNVLRGANGIQGLDLLESTLPDVILSDISMPGMDGLTFLQKIREHGTYAHIPCIILSGSAEDREISLQHGANGFLLKPFRNEQLALALNPFIAY